MGIEPSGGAAGVSCGVLSGALEAAGAAPVILPLTADPSQRTLPSWTRPSEPVAAGPVAAEHARFPYPAPRSKPYDKEVIV